jgi:hypothetical protein
MPAQARLRRNGFDSVISLAPRQLAQGKSPAQHIVRPVAR